MIIDGKKLSEELLEQLKEERRKFDQLILGLIAVGNIEDKLGFIKAKAAAAKKLDIDFRLYELPENLNREELRQRISQIARAKTISGIIIQLPLPKKFKPQYFLNAVIPAKDVDCLATASLGKFYTDTPTVRPPAVEVINFISQKFDLTFRAKLVTVVGYGNLVGKPIAHYLLKQAATVAVVNSKTPEKMKEQFLNEADFIISGVGQKNLIQDCKNGAVLIDFGCAVDTESDGKLDGKIQKIHGDIDWEKLANKAKLVTPTPGGTGPILVAMIYKNLLKLAQFQKQ